MLTNAAYVIKNALKHRQLLLVISFFQKSI